MTHFNKSLSTLAAVLIVVLFLPACDSGFEELNVNPTQATQIQPQFLLPTAQLAIAGTRYEMWRGNMIYSSAFVQHLANTWWAGAQYAEGSDDWWGALWRVAYNGAGDSRRAYIKTLQDLIENNQDDPNAANYVAAGRVLRVFAFHRLTDVYGDIPYSEAGLGFINDDITPAYDPQSEIYPDMLNELQEAAAQFDPSLPFQGDLLYDGDVERWRRFSYSLMLRLGLRLVKVDAGAAQNWVQTAIAGGVMQSNEDIAMIEHAEGPDTGPNGLSSNGNSDVFATDQPMLLEAFVDYLKETNDPRLPILGALYDGPANSADAAIVSTNPDDLFGWPPETDATTVQDHPAYDPDLGFYGSFAQPHRIIRDLHDPTFFQTYAEVEFMLAEAAIRGWHGGDPATHYANGVRAAMQQLAFYDDGGAATIPPAAIDAYLAANPYDAANGLEQVNTQYWVATFLNGYEAWANYRRTGFPDLTPVNYPGNPTGGQIPRRLRYPSSEPNLNPENYNAAIQRQGPDVMMTRVWWDQ